MFCVRPSFHCLLPLRRIDWLKQERSWRFQHLLSEAIQEQARRRATSLQGPASVAGKGREEPSK